MLFNQFNSAVLKKKLLYSTAKAKLKPVTVRTKLGAHRAVIAYNQQSFTKQVHWK